MECENGNLTIVLNINSKGICPAKSLPPCPPCPPCGVDGKPSTCSQPSARSCTSEGDTDVEVCDFTDPNCDPDNPKIVTLEDVMRAYSLVKGNVIRTPCMKSRLGETLDMELYFKKEFMQYTGNFKERGANHVLQRLKEKNPGTAGAVSASAGNHASAMAYHGKLLGVPIVVVMPVTAPIMKRKLCEDLGATVIMHGRVLCDSIKYGLKYARENGMEYVNGYDHVDVLAGAGTIALEVLEDIPDVDAIVTPVGGGGLLAGTCAFMKNQPDHQPMVFAVETDMCPGFSEAIKVGHPTSAKISPTLADGLAVSMVGCNAYATAAPLVDKVIMVEEKWCPLAILRLLEVEKAVVEGAGCVGLAAILSGQLDILKGKKVCVLLSGGNIDTTILGRVIERALVADGRIIWCSVTIPDKPHGLPDLLKELDANGVNVIQLEENRAFVQNNIWNVEVKVKCEVLGPPMIENLETKMKEIYCDNFKIIEKAILTH